VTGVYAAQVVVPAADTSPAPIAGIAPSYGPKTVSAVPNATAIVRRIWLPGLDAGYDPQGLAVDGGGIYVSAYRSKSLRVRRGPCRVIRIDLETGGRTDNVPVAVLLAILPANFAAQEHNGRQLSAYWRP